MQIEAFLLALAMLETGNNPKRIGHAGEMSAYQITPAVWREHTKIPIDRAVKNEALAETVARLHIDKLSRRVPKNCGIVYWTAVQWNAGTGTARKAKWTEKNLPRSVRDYAKRFIALYNCYEKDLRLAQQ